ARRYGNAGSRGDTEVGGTGSTPLTQFEMQNAHDLSQKDMGDWLSKVLGVNTEYGRGEHDLISGGQNAANSIGDLLKSFGTDITKMNFGRDSERNENRNNIWSGLFNIGKNGLFG
ncbi:MAG TPA: hypothetical protein VK590_08010, partial [Saprospiraceae bacterium]|nr:hypothetical protein [Saprospiraceae bacterium]